jgi:hypothetical protein
LLLLALLLALELCGRMTSDSCDSWLSCDRYGSGCPCCSSSGCSANARSGAGREGASGRAREEEAAAARLGFDRCERLGAEERA